MSWQLASFSVLAVALAGGFAWYERSHPSARVLALVATMAALAALGRIAFAPLPNVKPTTDIVLISGAALGGAPGFAVGALAALTSNLFFGQGPWTPWQMAAWGGVASRARCCTRVTRGRLGRVTLAAACGIAGLAYGAVLNFSTWATYTGDHSLGAYIAIAGTALPFDIAHAAGNVAFALAFGPALLRALERFRRRFEVTWRPAAAIAAPLAVVAALLLLVPAAGAADPAQLPGARPERRRRMGPGARPGLLAAVHGLGFARHGRERAQSARRPPRRGHPARLHARARRPARRHRRAGAHDPRPRRRRGEPPRTSPDATSCASSSAAATPTARTPAASCSPRSACSRSRRRAAPRRRAPAPRELDRAPAERGRRFSVVGRGGQSSVDDTASAIQALVAGGRRSSRAVSRGVGFLRRSQNPDGGFPLGPDGPSNAQSTAYAVQGFVAAGRDPARVRRGGSRDPLAYLRSLTTGSGAVRYSRTSAQTPVWVTAQAAMALARKPLPLRPVARRSGGGGAGGSRRGGGFRRSRRGRGGRLPRGRPCRPPAPCCAWRATSAWRRACSCPLCIEYTRPPVRPRSAGCNPAPGGVLGRGNGAAIAR